MSNCAACGKEVKGGIGMGGTLLCRECAPIIEAEITNLREAGKTVSVPKIAREMLRETSVGGYLLRDIPEGLWGRAKHAAVDKGISLRELILKAVDEFIK